MLFSWFVPLFRNDFQSYANHVVTIVGYDDDFPKEYFYDPNNTIGGNGAYIVKNSWGTDWGDEGYFYISYYDQSLGEAITLDFKVNTSSEKAADTKLQSYDFSPKIYVNEIKSSDKASMANVFEADNNMYLRTVGYTSVTNNEELEYQVYLLDQDAKTPTDGTLAATVHSSCAFSGYHTADLDTPVFLKKGQRYSVVVTVKREDGKYGIALHPQINEKGLRESLDDSLKSIEESDLSDRMKEQYRKNMEESFAYFILYDASGNFLDTYRLDPVTGKGTDQNGNAVNLPQTGVQSTGTAVTASAAVLMAVSGAFMMLRSLGRKKKED